MLFQAQNSAELKYSIFDSSVSFELMEFILYTIIVLIGNYLLWKLGFNESNNIFELDETSEGNSHYKFLIGGFQDKLIVPKLHFDLLGIQCVSIGHLNVETFVFIVPDYVLSRIILIDGLVE